MEWIASHWQVKALTCFVLLWWWFWTEAALGETHSFMSGS